MRTVKENKKAKNKIKFLGLWKSYEKQRAYFITDPSYRFLDFIFIDKKNGIGSFKINNQYRVKIIKNSSDLYTVFDVGDFHRRQKK
ncbi:hypothetical protein A3C26_01750 [Candidatus Daviesbacteria bacterium RIFCSPHIGHO2_02_FULL_39_12]|uniref:Uncharacterized protein n=2 Tax=Candidatus Daviesiibacteriota TaxID=1752718 RepID=A0A1F5JAQ0_9BACT|nr:MAG: hypothetical protein A3C26_01750 [Candidatus Daviesbacteria bacterium RIFCSPHIGHO2_02_FULL_39_12]OGE72698.1 MAG: hypothetical protein A3H40_00075 [Candidatus Daviesbacteria bacterium RIFCSPLOWO2_02_FULL_38_15]